MRRILFLLPLFIILMAPALGQIGTQHGVKVSWQASTSAVTGYNVYRATGSAAPVKLNAALIPGISYIDGSAATSTTYSYFATAMDSGGDESSASNTSTITTPAAFPTNPASPSGCSTAIQ